MFQRVLLHTACTIYIRR